MDIYPKALHLIDENRPFAFALVIRSSGSVPQKAGAKALFEPAGAIHGTLGGGCLEAESRKRALDAVDQGRALVFDLTLNDDYGWDDGLICGGKVRVYAEPTPARHRDTFAAVDEALSQGRRGVLMLRVSTDSIAESQWIPENEIASYSAYPGSSALSDCLLSTLPMYCVEQTESGGMAAEIYIEPVEPKPVLLISGGGNIGCSVAKLATWLGFDVTVIDDRAIFTDPARYPEGVKTICGDLPKEVAAFPIHELTYVLIVTRGHRHDGVVLKECIHSRAAYIGMIGSKRKAHITRQGLIDEGFATEADFERVYSPVGLDIGAVTVEEIAMSIASQLVAARRKRNGAANALSIYSTP